MFAQILEIATASAAVMIAALAAVAAWSISISRPRGSNTPSTEIASLRARLAKVETLIERTASAKLLAEVDDLAGAVASLRASNRKEFSRLWGRVGREEQLDLPAAPETPEEVRARLRAQHGLPKANGSE